MAKVEFSEDVLAYMEFVCGKIMEQRKREAAREKNNKRGKLQFVIKAAIGTDGASSKQIRAAVKEAGFNINGVPTVLGRMVKGKVIVKTDDGLYRLNDNTHR